jgi:hypothetical protein
MSPPVNDARGWQKFMLGFSQRIRWLSQFAHKMFLYLLARFMLGRSDLATWMILDARGRSPHVLVK